MLELMPDLSFMVNRFARLSVVDELTRGLAHATDDKKRRTKLLLVFTLQIYVDILQNFVPACESLDAMQAESRRIKHAIIECESNHLKFYLTRPIFINSSYPRHHRCPPSSLGKASSFYIIR